MQDHAKIIDARTHNLPTVTVILPAVLMDLFPGSERRFEVSAANVADLLDVLDDRWPGMRDRVRDSTPAIRRHINVFVDGARAKLDTPLSHGGKVYIFTAMSGG
jgi:molybdopterin converting factor small subunit